ncbi:molecular chaperone TorD family protein [Paenibacillus sp. D2_2]|uniref:TorD/DmsD family molecular chaperone n=1 Tax=Paenibacillus sp. D2_2 TaxID=3073092 RepID=UPI0028161D6E|nr:molecular chaperone TorD family protein [Paenibacillus sp. D2_2]WMT40730.1 molecular chaperone TorD family protein [Paenibacillus sp. D2_2]
MTMLFTEQVVISQDQAKWLKLRGWGYRLLVDFLGRPPRMSLIAQWHSQVELNNTVPMSSGGRRLINYLESIPENEIRRACYSEAEEFERLFMGPTAKVPTCESLYRAREEGIDALECASDIRTFYMESGIVFNKLNGERDDNIALELEYMAVMSEEMLDKLNLHQSLLEGLDLQIRFLESHLLKWTEGFTSSLTAATTSPLYIGLAEMMNEFLNEDLNRLQAWRAQLH